MISSSYVGCVASASVERRARRVADGGGRALIDEGLASLEARGFSSAMVWVLEGNTRAIRFYEARGLRLDGSRHEDHALPQLGMRRALRRRWTRDRLTTEVSSLAAIRCLSIGLR